MNNTQIFIEAIGYLGSALVLVSFLMASVFKLRIVNSIGSIIFTIYAVIIHSYPTAVMNACLVLINVYYLIKMSNTTRTYDFIKTEINDSLLKYAVDLHKDDIAKCFPGISLDFSKANCSYVVCHNGKPAGLFIGERTGDSVEILLDYSTPEYRDFSIGKFLFSNMKNEGIKSVSYRGSVDNHKAYLSKTGFVDKGDHYEKQL